ncbi:MAG TPA: YceI family protein [Actinomycetota bacterium]|nr:YceI family protein [Actinomycetota bacterium]
MSDQRARRTRSEDQRTSPVLIAGFGVAAIVVFLAVLLVVRALDSEEPPEVALASRSPAAGGATASPEDAATNDPTSFDGAWTIDAASGSLDDGTASFAGYRIEEELGGIGTNTAVGRTQLVQGTMTVAGTSVTDLDVTVDMASLRSDDERRDSQLASRGLETARFPTATFELAEPIILEGVPELGASIATTAVGDLTLHGVTRRVDVPVDARWTGEHIEVAASLDIALADYDIEPPTGFLVLSIDDTGTIELHLLFRRG